MENRSFPFGRQWVRNFRMVARSSLFGKVSKFRPRDVPDF